MDCSVDTNEKVAYCMECSKKLEIWEKMVCSTCEELIAESLK
jgi:predicted amidophosphoribosyltransferase